ncbi:MAG: hypothetical protein QGF67_03890 [Lentisphaeria bacterium]|nr:hypothetical protein [Lentisphaeria bacterium]
MRTATSLLMVMTLFACVQWADANVVAKWTFDDGTATDLVGVNDGVAVGNVTPMTEGSRNFLNFDEGYVNFGDLNGALVGSSFSVEYTFRRNSAGWEFAGSGNYNFIRLCCGGISWGWGLGCQAAGGNCGGHLNANYSIGNEWVHLVTTYDQPTRTQSVYFDGVLVGTNIAFDDFGTIPPQNPTDDEFIVGAVSGTGNGGGWYQVPGWTQGNGDIDEVVVHDEAIVPLPPPVAAMSRWTFDDGTATDVIGPNDGVVVGTVTPGTEGSRSFLNFNEGYVNCGDLGQIRSGNSFSIEYVARRNSPSWEFAGTGNFNFIRLCCGGISWGWGLGCPSSGGNCGGHLNVNTSGLDDWFQLVVTYDQTTKTQSMYLNGQLLGTNEAFDDFGTSPPQNPASDEFVFGAVSGTGNGGGWYGAGWGMGNGDIDEVIFYDGVISPPFNCEQKSLFDVEDAAGACEFWDDILAPILTDCATIKDNVITTACAVFGVSAPTSPQQFNGVVEALADAVLGSAVICGDIAPGGEASAACRAEILSSLP